LTCAAAAAQLTYLPVSRKAPAVDHRMLSWLQRDASSLNHTDDER